MTKPWVADHRRAPESQNQQCRKEQLSKAARDGRRHGGQQRWYSVVNSPIV
jgi:hypothetical protein